MRSGKHGLAEHGFARYRYEGPQVEGSALKAMGAIGLIIDGTPAWRL
jgi:hypothetical protein